MCSSSLRVVFNKHETYLLFKFVGGSVVHVDHAVLKLHMF